MDGNGAQFVKRLWIGLDLGKAISLKPYCVDEFHDSFHWKAACGADSVNIVIKRH